MSNAKLFDSAVAKVESASIRAWAQGQRETWLKIAAHWKRDHRANVDMDAVTAFATYITATAIGL